MSRLDLTCHNYSFVVQYRHNDSVYRCSFCPENVHRGSSMPEPSWELCKEIQTSSDSVKYMGIYKWMWCGVGGGITEVLLSAHVINTFSAIVCFTSLPPLSLFCASHFAWLWCENLIWIIDNWQSLTLDPLVTVALLSLLVLLLCE